MYVLSCGFLVITSRDLSFRLEVFDVAVTHWPKIYLSLCTVVSTDTTQNVEILIFRLKIR
jgi:hypothetical protein